MMKKHDSNAIGIKGVLLLILLWTIHVAEGQDFPAWVSSYANPDPLPDAGTGWSYGGNPYPAGPAVPTSQDIFGGTNFGHPDPANRHANLFPTFPPVIRPAVAPVTAKTIAAPVLPKVVLPAQPTVAGVPSTLSPLTSPDHFVRITMRITGPVAVNRDPASYACLLSQPDVGRTTISTGRFVETRDAVAGGTNGRTGPLVDRPTRRLGGPWAVVNMTGSGAEGFGAYYCRGDQPSKDTTTVVGLFLTADSKIVPAYGRFTRTVGLGTVGVSISMMLRLPADVPTNHVVWRKDGGDVIEEQRGLASFVFRRPITLADSGVYECYYANERNQGRHGLVRLIVRACPNGSWRPPRCNGVCDMCYNGGVCDEVTGKCICPPGFMGDNCQQSCGYNRFGVSCEHRCLSSQDNPEACRRSQFCLPDPFGCVCNAGFAGLGCFAACENGRFGAGCLQRCHCASGQCDRFTGRCVGTTSVCARGWTGHNCQIPNVCRHGYYGAECVNKCHCENGRSCERVSGQCPWSRCAPGFGVFDGQNHCSQCHPGTYGPNCHEMCTCLPGSCDAETGQCHGLCYDPFIPPTCQAGFVGVTFDNVNEGQTAGVNCSLTARFPSLPPEPRGVRLYRGSRGSNQTGVHRKGSSVTSVGNALTVMFGVDGLRAGEVLRCVVTADNGTVLAHMESTAKTFTPPQLNDPPVISDNTATSLTVSWRPWTLSGRDSVGDPPIVGYVILYRASATTVTRGRANDWLTAGRVSADRTSFVRKGLLPHTWYDVSVVAVREGPGGEGPPSPWVTAITACRVPAQPYPVLASTDPMLPREISLAWQTPDPSIIRCPSGLAGINLYYREADAGFSENGTHRLFNPTVNSQRIIGLHVYTKYLVSMSVVNEAGEGAMSPETEIFTPEELPPAPVQLQVAESSSSSILLSWETPSPPNVNGKIRRFDLHYMSTVKTETIQIHGPDYNMKYRISGLTTNRTYQFKVRTVNGIGPGEWSETLTAVTYNPPSALQANKGSGLNAPHIGLAIGGVFVGLFLLVIIVVGGANIRRRIRARQDDELSTLRETIGFTSARPSIVSYGVSDFREQVPIQDEDKLYTTSLKPLSRQKRNHNKATSPRPDEHRYEYIDALRLPAMRFAALANEDETLMPQLSQHR